MAELKEAFENTTDYKKRCAILTLSPYTQEKTAEFFETTVHMVKKSREMKEKYGILPDVPTMKRGGNRLTDEVKEKG